EKVHVQ
nr:Chain B, Spike glycoprotein [Porcine epidemic diarrhea virus]